MLRDTVRRKSVGAGLLAKAVGSEKNVDGRNAIAGKRAPTPSYIHAARYRAPQIRRSRLAGEGVGSAKKYGRTKRHRGQASTPSYIHVARSRAPQIRRSRLAGEGVGSAKIISTAETLSRASALLHRHIFMLRDRVRRKSVGAGLLAKALGPRKLYRLTKRHRGQARSYTVLHACCEIACAANS
jgi:hypothetical protein